MDRKAIRVPLVIAQTHLTSERSISCPASDRPVVIP
jgi:hypothetical protein